MPEQARVTSLEAVEQFRAKLIIYRDRASRLLDEVNHDTTRMQLWLQNEQRAHWEAEIYRRKRECERLEQELFTSRISSFKEALHGRQLAVRKAREAVYEAEEKLRMVKHWDRQFENRVEVHARQVEKLRQVVGKDLGAGVAWLAEALRTLAAYAEIAPGRSPSPSPQPESADASEKDELS